MTLTTKYDMMYWQGLLLPYAINHQIPIEFMIEGIREESGGNPCEIGNPEQYGPDGNPREMGPYQFYNPDDLQFLKIDGHALRAFCNPAKVTYRTKDGRTVQGPSQEVIRDLTLEEVEMLVNGIVNKVSRDRSYAAHALAGVGATWPADSPDFWRAVKLVHGLPGILSSGMPAYKRVLGQAPISWSAFKQAILGGHVTCDAATERYRSQFPSIFANAEKATATMRTPAIA